MKILLPHRTVSLDYWLTVEEKKHVIESLLSEEIEFHAQTMTLEEYLVYTWDKQKSKVIMDMFAYYLTKEEKNLEILSRIKINEMTKGTNKYTHLDDLSEDDKTLLGIETLKC